MRPSPLKAQRRATRLTAVVPLVLALLSIAHLLIDDPEGHVAMVALTILFDFVPVTLVLTSWIGYGPAPQFHSVTPILLAFTPTCVALLATLPDKYRTPALGTSIVASACGFVFAIVRMSRFEKRHGAELEEIELAEREAEEAAKEAEAAAARAAEAQNTTVADAARDAAGPSALHGEQSDYPALPPSYPRDEEEGLLGKQ